MPRIALVCLCLVGACRFDADYAGGRYQCHDGECPAGLVCRDELDPPICAKEPMDAAVDMPIDDVLRDGPSHALTCADPERLPNSTSMRDGTTTNHPGQIQPLCKGSMMLGLEAVYSIDPGQGRNMLVSIETSTMSYSVVAYVVMPCTANACIENKYATPGNPINITTLAGTHYIVVDSNIAGANGTYTLNVSFP